MTPQRRNRSRNNRLPVVFAADGGERGDVVAWLGWGGAADDDGGGCGAVTRGVCGLFATFEVKFTSVLLHHR